MTLRLNKTNRVVAFMLAIIMCMALMLAVSNTQAHAIAILSDTGKTTMTQLLAEPVGGNSVIQKYSGSTEWALGESLSNVPTYSNTDELGEDVQVFLMDDNQNFIFDGKVFQGIKDSSLQQALVNEFAKLMAGKYRSEFTDADRQSIYDEVKDNCGEANAAMVAALFADTKADMFSALRMFQPFRGIAGTILGIFVLVILILLIGSTALDIAYINFPIARNFMYGDKDKDGGDKGAKKPWGVTPDACSVVDQQETGGDKGYKNPNIAYFRRRILTYIIVAIMILYLLSGQISGIIAWLMQLVSGFRM